MTYQDILTISRTLGLPMNKILEVFSLLRDEKTIENNLLVKKTGISKNVLNQLKKELASLFNPTDTTTSLSMQGQTCIEEIIPSGYKSEDSLFDFLPSEQIRHSEALLEKYASERPASVRELDQFSATNTTVGKRAALLDFFSDVQGKKILFLGDDDLTSIAVASLHKAAEITVVDIDARMLHTIQTIAEKEHCKINLITYDAKDVPPQQLMHTFDVVFTDPPYTKEGIELFISRSIQFLRNDQTSRIYLCYGNSDRAKERFLPIYETLLKSGLMIRWVFDKFNRYLGAESIGSSSTLYICEYTPQTKPFTNGSSTYENIYTTI